MHCVNMHSNSHIQIKIGMYNSFIRRFSSSFQPVKGMKDLVGKDAWLYSRVIVNLSS